MPQPAIDYAALAKKFGAVSSGPAGDPDAPEDPLAKYPPQVQTIAKGLLNYKLPLPAGRALADPKSPWGQGAIAAQEVDPEWSTVEYPTRLKLINSYTSGKPAENIRSINTLIGHLGTMRKAADELHNSGGILTPTNRIGNWFEQHVMGDPRVNNFNTTRELVASELRKAVGDSAAESAQKRVIDLFDPNGSPEQLHGAINTALDMVSSRAGALDNQYKESMGSHPRKVPILYPHSRDVLKQLGSSHFGDLDANFAPGGASAGTPPANRPPLSSFEQQD